MTVISLCIENMEILVNFIYLGIVVQSICGSDKEVIWHLGLTSGIVDSLIRSIFHCLYLCRRKFRVYMLLLQADTRIPTSALRVCGSFPYGLLYIHRISLQHFSNSVKSSAQYHHLQLTFWLISCGNCFGHSPSVHVKCGIEQIVEDVAIVI